LLRRRDIREPPFFAVRVTFAIVEKTNNRKTEIADRDYHAELLQSRALLKQGPEFSFCLHQNTAKSYL
jgi:hypothetical protein